MDKEYWPEVIQVIPNKDYIVKIFFSNGIIKSYDFTDIIKSGIFIPLQNRELFVSTCTVLNKTLAWSLDLTYDTSTCLDIDPFTLYEDGILEN